MKCMNVFYDFDSSRHVCDAEGTEPIVIFHKGVIVQVDVCPKHYSRMKMFLDYLLEKIILMYNANIPDATLMKTLQMEMMRAVILDATSGLMAFEKTYGQRNSK